MGLQFFPQAEAQCPLAPPCPAGCVQFGFPPFITCVAFEGGSCNANDYLPPAVMIEPLPGVRPKIEDAFNKTSPGGGTPTRPAMQSAVQVMTAYAKQFPERKVIIVLATDGSPNDCNSTNANVAAEAQTAFQSVPSVLTFVISIDDVAGLNDVAQAGGTKQALIVNTASAAQEFLEAMNEIRGKALGCEYLIPQPKPGDTLDYNKVNVLLGSQKIPGMAGAADCADEAGWYYDAAKTKILLCPKSCDMIQAGAVGSVSVTLGCETLKPPPPT
jgi:hypothetical protein